MFSIQSLFTSSAPAISSASSSSARQYPSSSLPIYNLKVTGAFSSDGVCDSVLYGAPLIVKPTACWMLDWEELENNRQHFMALCQQLVERVGVLAMCIVCMVQRWRIYDYSFFWCYIQISLSLCVETMSFGLHGNSYLFLLLLLLLFLIVCSWTLPPPAFLNTFFSVAQVSGSQWTVIASGVQRGRGRESYAWCHGHSGYQSRSGKSNLYLVLKILTSFSNFWLNWGILFWANMSKNNILIDVLPKVM